MYGKKEMQTEKQVVSMVGDEKKTVLRNLPDKLPEIIDAEHGDTVALIWKVLFSLLLKIIDFYHWLYK